MPKRPITQQPRPSLAGVLGKAGARVPELDGFARLTPAGRDALYWGFRILRGGSWRVAWLPDYHCGAEVEAALAADFEVAFYAVDENLSPHLESLRGRVPADPGPVVLTHYFGHPSSSAAEVTALCAAEGVPLVVDACHGPLAAAGEDGTGGDVVAVSFRKVLGTLDGGGLHVDRSRVAALTGTAPAPLPAPGRRVVRPLLDSARRTWGWTGEDWADAGRGATVADPDRAYGRRVSWPSERALRRWTPPRVAARRRDNWTRLARLLEGVEGFSPVFPVLGEHAVPLSLAVRVGNRDGLARALRGEGVDSYTFGKHAHPVLPAREAPGAARLRDEILGLPVHHDLAPHDVERLAEIVGRHLPRHSILASEPCAASPVT